jgi:lipopolysaccharide biosynthesis protein
MGENRKRMGEIIELISDKNRANSIVTAPSRYPFFGGTMFWCRLDFLSPLLHSSLTPADFNTERGQVDGTTAHAIERILGKTLHVVTGKKMYTVKKAVVSELPAKAYQAHYKHVG